MNRKQKELLVSELRREFTDSEASFVISCNMNAQAAQNFKKKLRLAGARMTIAKNTLLRLVADKAAVVAELKPHFHKQTALVFASRNASAVASLIKHESAEILVKGGLLHGTVINAEKFAFVASIPPLEVLKAQVCGTLLAPIAKLVYVLQAASEKTDRAKA